MNLYLGSGTHRLAGFATVDKWPECGADFQWDVRKLEVADASVDSIVALHLVESFYQWEFPDVLKEWFRALKPGGRLILEGTDFTTACHMDLCEDSRERISGEWGIYGRQDIPQSNTDTLHKFTWRKESLIHLLESIGFQIESVGHATTHDPARDYQIQAIKKWK